MKQILIVIFMLSFFNKAFATNEGSAYDYEFNGIDGNIIKLSNCSC